VTTWTLYALSSTALIGICLYAVFTRAHLIRKVLALNILGSSIFLLLVSFARRNGAEPDPVPHAMVLTGIVVAVSATAFTLAMVRRLFQETGYAYLPEDVPPSPTPPDDQGEDH
jgi:multicomponent Na+:H+ antiporter subunit C